MCKGLKSYPILLLLLMFFTITAAEDPNRNISGTDHSRIIVKGSKAWAIACSAVLNERNHGYHDSLSTKDISTLNIKRTKDLLFDTWEIKSKQDLYDNLKWLDEVGHRIKFNTLGALLQKLGPQEYADLLKNHENDPQTTQQIVIAKEYYEQLGEKSLIGWDYSRYIILCRWSYTAGYIDEEEAWELIMPIARGLQKTFDSWEDLGKNYIIGRQFWSYEETQKYGFMYEEAFQRLLEMRSSPWNIYPWDMNLTETESESDHQPFALQNQKSFFFCEVSTNV
jgi:hypothetical protein